VDKSALLRDKKYAKSKCYVALIGRLFYPLNPPEGDAQAVQGADTITSPYFFKSG